jgi:hypothetical protein
MNRPGTKPRFPKSVTFENPQHGLNRFPKPGPKQKDGKAWHQRDPKISKGSGNGSQFHHEEIAKHLLELDQYRPFLIGSSVYRNELSGNVYDNHCIFIRSDVCSVSQIKKVFDKAIGRLMTDFSQESPPLDPEYHLNVIADSKEEYIGRSFIYFRDPRLYNAFLGYNLDGKTRVDYISVPQTKIDKQFDKDFPKLDPLPGVATPGKGSGGGSNGGLKSKSLEPKKKQWGDEGLGEEDEPVRKKIELKPLITLSPVTDLTPEQETHLRCKSFVLQISPAFITPGLAPGFLPKVLIVRGLKPEILDQASDLLMKIFAKYAQSQTVYKKYPIIRVYPPHQEGSDAIAKVIFNSYNDAQFARLMQKKTYLPNPNGKGVFIITCQQAREMRKP